MGKAADSGNLFIKDFRHSLMALVIPIALQSFISAAINSADIIMLGTVSQSAMSAISLAGQITFVIMFFYMGLTIGAGTLTAQYWGKNDVAVIRRVLSIACIFSSAVSFIFFIASFCLPASLMRVFTNDIELISYGSKYLQVLSFSYLVMGLSQMYLSVVRSMEKARFSAFVSSASLLMNIALNALCIFILFPGQPEKTIIGVAVATIIARLVELGCCIVHSLRSGNIYFSLPELDKIQKLLIQDYLRYTIPALANYIVYGAALAASTAIIGHVSSDMVAANAVAGVVRNLSSVLCRGIAGGGSVLIGKYLGNGDIQSAKKAGIKIYIYALFFGILACITVLLLISPVLNIVSLNASARGYLEVMLIISAVFCISKSLNSTIIGGVFCAGGDAKFGFICDAIVMWVIIIPLAWLCAFVWQVPPVYLYIVICFDEAIKTPVAIIRFCQYHWLKNITRDLS